MKLSAQAHTRRIDLLNGWKRFAPRANFPAILIQYVDAKRRSDEHRDNREWVREKWWYGAPRSRTARFAGLSSIERDCPALVAKFGTLCRFHYERKLSRKQEEAIVALRSPRSVEEAARACNTPVRTLYRWLGEPDFEKAYRVARRKAFGQATARLQQGSGAAATTLLKLMLDSSTPASTRVRAAECVLGHAAKAIETEDVEARVEALEQAAANTASRR